MVCRQGGFTLIEVVVAFAVAGMVIALLSQITAAASRNANRVGKYEHALFLAESLLDEAQTLTVDGLAGRTGAYQWQVSLTPFERDPGAELAPGAVESPLELVSVVVTVSWGVGGNARPVTLQRLMPRPSDPDAGLEP